MKKFYPDPVKKRAFKPLLLSVMMLLLMLCAKAQTCPAAVTTTLSSNPNTYYPGTTATLSAGATSITLGAAASGAGANYGTTPISAGDLLLIIQMQGAQINTNNSSDYGDGVLGGSGNGYLTSPNYLAGNMEYVVASNAVPLAGGTLNLVAGTVNSYKNSNYTVASGQYRYQVVRVGSYYNVTLGSTINVGVWNGTAGGVFVIYVTNDLDMNGKTINASNAGFRGGAGRQLNGGSGLRTDFVTLASNQTNGSKAEGFAGTPQYTVNYTAVTTGNGSGTLVNSGVEGYPNGSMGQGAPANAGGGGTDGNASANDQNAGGGGGGNGGLGGKGGKSWSTAITSGGEPGATFNEVSPSRLVLGGGGGAGTNNNATGLPGGGLSSSGAPGGGIVIITTRTISNTGTILANGKTAGQLGGSPNETGNDASGGGGAGGSVVINAQLGTANLTVQAKGGNGASNTGTASTPANAQSHGPGGGGGGGVIYSTGALNTSNITGGAAGTTQDASAGSGSFGASAGTTGLLVQNMSASQTPTIPMTCFVLPTSFLSVTATHNNKDVKVKWVVTNESQTREYIVERSADGNNFAEVGAISATGAGVYQFPDIAGSTDTVLYYRIERISLNGSHEYSKLAVVNFGAPLTQDISVMPNPFTGSATVKFTSFARANVTMKLMAINGMVHWQRQFMASQGVNTFRLDNVMNVPDGIYLLQLNNGVQVQTVKVMIRH